MGDPLSTAASIAGLISLGLQTTEYLFKYYQAYRGQDEHLTQTADKLGDLLNSFQIIDDILRKRKWRPDEHTILQSIERSIIQCEEVIRELQDESKKLKKEPRSDYKTKLSTAGRRAAYPFRRSTPVKLGEDVSDIRDNLFFALQALQLKDNQDLRDDIEALTLIVEKSQAQNISASIQKWLKAPDATIDFNVANAKRHPGTGQWLVQGSAFTIWLHQDNSFLWLYGFAGCGKSVLSSTAIQHVQKHQRQLKDSATAFFFFTFTDESKQDASAALRALLLQLCGQTAGCDIELDKLKDTYNHGLPSVPVLTDRLRQTVNRCGHVYIFLDALDESPADTSREEVLSIIQTMRNWSLPGLHLLVTSRDVPEIRDCFQSGRLAQNAEHIWLNNNNIQNDISDYVSHKIEDDPQLSR